MQTDMRMEGSREQTFESQARRLALSSVSGVGGGQ